MTSLFGNLNSNPSNTTGNSLFGGLGTNTAGTSAQPAASIFGTTTNKPSLFGQTQTAQSATNTGGLFSQTQQPAAGGLFGASQQTNGNLNQSTQSTVGQQPQGARPLDQTLRFGLANEQTTVTYAQDGKEPWWQEGKGLGTYRSIPQQMRMIQEKWDPANPASPLRTYIYQHVHDDKEALQYRPGPGEDPEKWEQAVQARPGPAWVPLHICSFYDLGKKAQIQQEAIAKCNMILHEINNSLDLQLEAHRTKYSARLAECRRRHKIISQRSLALGAKVQILKNRGYVMDNAEEELKAKLLTLEREILDPSINAREQEVWARMLGIRERSRRLKMEMEKLQPTVEDESPLLDDDTIRVAKKVCLLLRLRLLVLTVIPDS